MPPPCALRLLEGGSGDSARGPCRDRRRARPSAFGDNRFVLILVPSHNDAECLERSLPRIREAMRPSEDRLVVIADRCTDATRAVAERLGSEVIERNDARAGEGKRGALLHALAEIAGDASQPVAIFDSDSLPSADFFRLAGAAEGPDAALQAFVDPIPNRSIVSRLAAYSEIVSQKISDRFRERLGWGVPFRGTGMVVSRSCLERGLARCETFVEDLELTILLAAAGVRVRRLGASVGDPKPDDVRGVVAQRARWLAGNASALIARRREIARLGRSWEGGTLVLSLFCKPRSLFFSVRLLAFVGLLFVSDSPAVIVLRVALGLFLAKDAVLLIGGLWAVDRPLFYLPAVLCSPLYPLIWAAGIIRSFGARRAWFSARR